MAAAHPNVTNKVGHGYQEVTKGAIVLAAVVYEFYGNNRRITIHVLLQSKRDGSLR